MSNIFIISGMSGAGEDSIITGLEKYFDCEPIVNTTSRQIRPGESQGNPYYFLTREEFENGIEKNDFVEYAKQYNDNYYGASYNELERVEKSGKIGLWKMEYQGVITAKKKFPEIKSIYIAPPSFEILKQRILKRNPDFDKKLLEERMEYNKEWAKHEYIYDYKVVNEEGKLDETIQKVAEIIKKNLK